MKSRDISLGPMKQQPLAGTPLAQARPSNDLGHGHYLREALVSIGSDLKYAVRMFRKNPGFTAVVVLTLALGIGSTTAVFSVISAVLLRPLPFKEPDRLVMVWEKREKRHEDRVVVSPGNFADWKAQSRSFESLAAMQGWSSSYMIDGEPIEVRASCVSDEFFGVLGVQPLMGRRFLPEESQNRNRAILGYGLWARLGADPSVIGHALRLNGQPYTVAGVMPRGFSFPNDSEVWFPFQTDAPAPSERGDRSLRVVGKLRAGVSLPAAQAEMEIIAARLEAAYPKENAGSGVTVVSLKEQIVGAVSRPLLMLLGGVFCVLLIACANVASLLLERAAAREREIAVRVALGATRWPLMRALLLESVLLALLGGMLGLAGAYWLVRAFVIFDPIHLPRVHEVAIDRGVLLWTFAAAVSIGILFGMIPALRASRPDLNAALKESPQALRGCRPLRYRGGFAIVQIALAMVLLVGSGLLIRSFVLRVTVPLGFRPGGALGVELPWSAHRQIDSLLERIRALPGVQHAGAGPSFPDEPAHTTCGRCIEIQGRPMAPEESAQTGRLTVTPDYFRAAGMALRSGRFIDSGDGADAPKVVVVNEAFARRFFPGEDPVSRYIRWSGDQWRLIVGIAGDVKGFGVDGEPLPSLYMPHQQSEWANGVCVLIRTTVPPASLAAAVRKEIRAWKKRMIIGRLDTVENLMSSSVVVPRFYMMLSAGLAALALLVAAVGVYGIINYSVLQRTRDIGVRMALGASRTNVLSMILGQGLAIVACGVGTGSLGAWAAMRVLETMLFQVHANDARAFAGGAGVLVLIGVLACGIPALRATRIDPIKCLHSH